MDRMRTILPPELTWLLKQLHSARGLYFYTLFCFGVSGLLSVIDPLIIKWLIDEVLPRRDTGMIPLAALGFFLPSSSASV
jgi:ABC-type bacteriocin/lantibiotic exporter with double-glycine peptidase domain